MDERVSRGSVDCSRVSGWLVGMVARGGSRGGTS
jgi:hypothetical protein